jgi:outer membrane protein TolC
LNFKREKTTYLPIISSYYNHIEKWKTPLFDFEPKDVIGINLTLPIFSSGQRSSLISQKKMIWEKATNDKIYTTNNLFMAADQYRSDLRIKAEKYQIQKKSKELSDVIYQRTLEKYREGVSSSMDLMNSQNQYLNNLTNYYQSIYDVVTAKSKLEKHYNINQNLEN